MHRARIAGSRDPPRLADKHRRWRELQTSRNSAFYPRHSSGRSLKDRGGRLLASENNIRRRMQLEQDAINLRRSPARKASTAESRRMRLINRRLIAIESREFQRDGEG